MKTSLTPTERELITVVREEWLDHFFSLKMDPVKAEALVDYLYSLCDRPSPQKIFLDSPLAIQAAANTLSPPREGGADVFYETITSWDYGWVALFDYFTRIGIVSNAKFEKHRDLMKSGIYSIIAFDKVCLICRPPLHIHLDDRGRLHDAAGSAITFADGYGQHYLSGVYFSPEIFTKCVIGNPSGKEILSVSNLAQRAELIKHHGYEKVMNDLEDLREIDDLVKRGKDGKDKHHRLFRFQFSPDQEAKFMAVDDFSSDRRFFLGVPPGTRTALEGLAWSFSAPQDAYAKIIVET